MGRTAHRLAIALTLAATLCAAAAPAAGAAPSASQRLIEAYAPITMLRSQEDGICDKSEEQFQPTTVSTVLGNPRVELKGPAGLDSDSRRSRRPPRPMRSPASARATTSSFPVIRSNPAVTTRATSPT